MEACEDFLCHQMCGGWPSLVPCWVVWPSGLCEVVDQRIKPDIDDLASISRDFDSPASVFARDGDVTEALFNKRKHFVPPRVRNQEARITENVFFKPVAVSRKSEVVDILADTLNLGPGFLDDAIFIDIRVSEERFVCDRVPAFVNAEIDIAGLFEAGEDFADDILVAVFACPDEVVIAAVQKPPRLDKALGDLVYKCLRCLTSSNGRIGYLLRMLIRAGQKPRVMTLHPVIPRLGIRQKRCRCRSDVRHGIDIVDRGGDIRSHGEFLRLCGEAARSFKGVMAATRATGAEPLSHRLGQSFDNMAYHLPDSYCN